jgi:hypothetical protein
MFDSYIDLLQMRSLYRDGTNWVNEWANQVAKHNHKGSPEKPRSVGLPPLPLGKHQSGRRYIFSSPPGMTGVNHLVKFVLQTKNMYGSLTSIENRLCSMNCHFKWYHQNHPYTVQNSVFSFPLLDFM